MDTRPPSIPARLPESPASSLDALPGLTPLPRQLAAAGTLFRQGDACVGIFRLVAGRIRLVRCTPSGADVILHTVRPDELFAEAALFSTHYHCDAMALEDCELLLYPKEVLMQQLMRSPEALWAFTGELAHRLQGLRSRFEIKQIRSAPERVMQFLRLRSDSSGTWTRDGTLKHLASDLGLTHEALYRALAKLEREGHITRLPTGIRLHVQPRR